MVPTGLTDRHTFFCRGRLHVRSDLGIIDEMKSTMVTASSSTRPFRSGTGMKDRWLHCA